MTPAAEGLLEILRERRAMGATPTTTRDLRVLRDQSGARSCAEVFNALDELYAAGLVRIARNGRLVLVDPSP